jgi:hypothetical protein
VAADIIDRGIEHRRGIFFDPVNGDAYFLALTALHNKMVPMWGSDGTGMTKAGADGRIRWFSLSSGNNYQALTAVHDGKAQWAFAGKSFGGQVDVFDTDGLRVATGAWNWPAAWKSGFVDIVNYGISGYLRPDGKPGVYVEDDLIGRFLRYRLDGGETLRKKTYALRWDGGAAAGKPRPPDTTGRELARLKTIPRVPELPVNGDWSAWVKAGVAPQIIALPVISWGRVFAERLFETYRVGTTVGAVAHDGSRFYVYFLSTDNTPNFADAPGRMFEADSIELWLEQEQFGLGFLKSGKPAIYKYRFHDRTGKAVYTVRRLLPDDCIWGRQLPDIGAHPLARVMESATGADMVGKPGYAFMARIDFAEVRLVGGLPDVPGREATCTLETTGKAGEIVRIGVAVDNIEHWSREQDMKFYWPGSLMYSDATRSFPFAFGE